MKIMWASVAPWLTDSFGLQTRLAISQLESIGHEVAVIGAAGTTGGILQWGNTPVYPVSFSDPYGANLIPHHCAHFGADVLVTLGYPYRYQPQAWRMRIPDVKWLAWVPIDALNVDFDLASQLPGCDRPIAVSKFGQELFNSVGIPANYIPHAVDTSLFYPTERAAARAQLSWPTDLFIVGLVVKNHLRKVIPAQVEAFANFHADYPNSLLYIHTSLTGDVDILWMLKQHGLAVNKDVIICDPYLYDCGLYLNTFMAKVYNAIDVLLYVTLSEGFGIGVLEAQSCGTPVIIGDWGAVKELFFSGWEVGEQESHAIYLDSYALQRMPFVDAIQDRLELAYRSIRAGNETELRAMARAGALDYDADLIAEKYWKPVLKEIETRISSRLVRL